jgi:hypothetical protein
MKKPERELRRSERKTKIINIDCTVEKFPDDIYGEKAKLNVGDSFRATTINVSETGMLVNCDFILPERTILKIEIPGGEVKEEKIILKASIIRTKRNAYKIFGRYAVGLHITEGKKEDIKKLIEHFN